ncbi:helix-turn-helix transcriptional regulator [Paenibacillus sp. FA6]|uniref:helix-turn-helix transcriptional regulator n=1 Tax=Paenibacillus sp. FA6 TaxID=3413029 RepID=UPI003F65FBD1
MKIDRLLAMTVLLLNRERVSAKELAERFEVSIKTICRDMDTLSQSGIPVFAHQGTSGGFEIMKQYTISRQYLTFGEISSIVAAVKGMGTVLDDSTFASLNEKVKALLSKSDKQQSEQQGEGIVFDLNPWGQGPEARNKVNPLRRIIQVMSR